MSSQRTFKIASIPGDGIGVDITEAAIQVLEKLSSIVGTFKFDFENFDWSSKNYKERGWYMPPDGMEQLQKHDAIYFGAVGWPGTSRYVPCHESRTDVSLRCPRPHQSVESHPPYSKVQQSVCECETHTHSPWHHFSTFSMRALAQGS